MTKHLIVLILLLCAGCGPPLTCREKIMLTTMIVAQGADYETSRRMHMGDPDSGYVELNPWLGNHPSNTDLLVFKLGYTSLLYALGEIWPEHREFFYTIGIISGGVAAGWNDRIYNQRE